jgi:CMP-N,N'-diacetyllegionaminic acid synthase
MNHKKLKILGIVGIRSGSKGVKDKNIKELAGKPLVAWILETAKKSRYINRIVVSTDSKDYAKIAMAYGADAPYLRPNNLSTDESPEFEYIKHMVEWLDKNENYQPDIIVRMMATSPLQDVNDIDTIIEKLIDEKTADSVVVIAKARQHPEKAIKIKYNDKGVGELVGYYSGSSKDVVPLVRQSYEPAYFRANAIACWLNVIYKTGSMTGDLVRYHEIQQERAIDIDSDIDFAVAEFLIKNK